MRTLCAHVASRPTSTASLAGIELYHGGVHAPQRASRACRRSGPRSSPSDYDRASSRKAMESADIRRVQADWVRRPQRSRDAGFDIVYVYGAHSYLPGAVPLAASTTSAPTSTAARSRTARASGSRLLEQVRDGGRRRLRDRRARIAVDALGPRRASTLDEGLEFVGLADHLVDLWDVNVGSIADWSKDSGASPLLRRGLSAASGPAGCARPPRSRSSASGAYEPGPDGGDRPQRRVGPHRRRPAVDRRPVPAEEDRGGPLRRDPRVHRLQRLHHRRATAHGHIGCTQNATAGEEYRRGWHPERFEPAANADKDVLVVGAGPGRDGVRHRAREARLQARPPRRRPTPEIGGSCAGCPRLPGLGEWGRVLDWRRIQLEKLRRTSR